MTALKLSERAMLAKLSIGSWGASIHDQEVTEEVSIKHKADVRDAGKYKKLLIARKFLQQVTSKASLAYKIHRMLTLPWDDDGTRILTSMGYMPYTTQMSLQRAALKAAVAQFVQGMPDYINEAKQRLGTMFNADDYPDPSTLTKKFYLDVEIKPLPEANDFRVGLDTNSVNAIVKDIESRTNQRVKAAVNDVFERIVDVTGKMSDKLKAYDNGGGEIFRDSLVYNIKELADLLPALNVTGDKRLDALQRSLENDLVAHSPEVLRTNEGLRKQTASKADQILKKVKGFMS